MQANPKPDGEVPVNRWTWWAAGLGLVVPMVLLFGLWPYQHWYFEGRTSVLWGWFQQVSRDEEWRFCLLVPLLVGWLVYRQRTRLRDLPLNGSPAGAVVAGVGLVFFWMGYKVDAGYLGFVAAHLVLGGLILLLGGRQWMRELVFPWLFLAFMWPMFPLEERLAFPLRLMTAGVSAAFLNVTGLEVVREGTALHSAAQEAAGLAQGDLFRLDVEEPCSGIRSLFSLLMISALYGYLTLRGPWQRLVLVLSAIPLAMVGNFARMVLLAVGSRWLGSDVAVGRNLDGHQEMSFFHTVAGFVVFGVALTGMFALGSLLERRRGRRRGLNQVGERSQETLNLDLSGGNATRGRLCMRHAGLAVLLAVATLGVCWGTDVSLNLANSGVQLKLPESWESYAGQPLEMSAEERNVLDEGVTLARTLYTSERGRRILATVIVGGPGKRTLHRPEVCLPGQGWTIASSSVLPLRLVDGQEAEVTVLQLFREREAESGQRVRMRALNVYWYVGSDGVTRPDYYGHISKGYTDALLKNLNHRWSMISLFVPVSEGVVGVEDPFSEFAALEETRTFAESWSPQIRAVKEP